MTIEEVIQFQEESYLYFEKRNPEFLKILREKKTLDDSLTKIMDEILAEYLKEVKAKRPKEDVEEEDGADPDVGVDVLDKATTKK